MRVLGIDPSSTSTGLAVVTDGKPEVIGAYRPEGKTALDRLFNFYAFIENLSSGLKPDVAGIEELTIFRNKNTTRVLSHFQAAGAIACQKAGAKVTWIRPAVARRTVFKRNLDKQGAYERIVKWFPDYTFKPFGQGGDDETDALVLALSAPRLV